jgi:hypothetical protein
VVPYVSVTVDPLGYNIVRECNCVGWCISAEESVGFFSIWLDGSSSTRWKVFLGTTSCCGTAWHVSLVFSGLFDDFAFFGVLANLLMFIT